MKTFVIVALIACLGMVVADELPREENVLVLTDDTFDQALAENDHLLVEFYAPWCGHCKNLAPHYAKAAEELGALDTPLNIAKVDATAERELAKKFEIQGFPTMKFFKNGVPTDYTGGRTSADIVSWVVKKSGPPAQTVTTVDEVKALAGKFEVVVVGFFDDAESAEAKAYTQAAGGNDEVQFAITSSADVAKEYGVSSPSVIVLQQFDDGRADFEGEWTAAAISTFVGGNSLPSIIQFSQASAPKIFGGPVKVHNLLFVDSTADNYDSLLEEFRGVAQQFKGDALFVYVTQDERRVLDYFGVTPSDLPSTVIATMYEGEQMKKFKFEEESVNGETLAKFVGEFLAGNLKPYLKSEPIPEDNDDPVMVLVGKNFEEVALNPELDVLVEFYAPWCGHCKALAPKYLELGEQFADVDSVIIAKMDATANEVDHPAVNVRGFPTIKFFPAGSDGNVMDYEGEREVDAFVKFIKENGRSEIPASVGDDEL